MKGYRLIQAIARANRVFHSADVLIVGCIGIAGELKAALSIYTGAQRKGEPAQQHALDNCPVCLYNSNTYSRLPDAIPLGASAP